MWRVYGSMQSVREGEVLRLNNLNAIRSVVLFNTKMKTCARLD